MKSTFITLALVGAAAARPTALMTTKREVPQEHSHRNINLAVNTLLQKNNPDNIQDPLFGLLGAKAAAEGAGKITDTDCLQQAVADQAFTNAKQAGDVQGMTMALIYRALERNTGSVGLASAPCKSLKAVNPEIAALQQHQDPAGDGAQALNKQIAEELARQIASIGGDPSMANEASTFAPGKIGDPTAAGNTCDDANNDKGCINTQGLRVDDLSAAEITAAVAGTNGTGAATGNNNNANKNGAKNKDHKNKNGNKNKNKNNGNQNAAAGNGTATGNEAATGKGAVSCNLGAATGGAATGNGAATGKGAAAGNGAATGNGAAAGGAATGGAATGGAATGGAATGNGAAAGNGAADFGGCDPTIKFGLPSDGRKEEAFEPTDLKTFNHGSAQKIAIISDFICSQLPNKCKANAAATTACKAAATAANGLTGQAAATAFNSALGL